MSVFKGNTFSVDNITKEFNTKIIENNNGIYFNFNNHIYRVNNNEILSTDNKYNQLNIPELKVIRFDIQTSGNIVASVNEYYVNSIAVFDKNLAFLYKIEDDNKFIKDIYTNEGFIALKKNHDKHGDKSHVINFHSINGVIIYSIYFDSEQISNIWLASEQPYLNSIEPMIVIIEDKSKILVPIFTNKTSHYKNSQLTMAFNNIKPYKKIIYGS